MDGESKHSRIKIYIKATIIMAILKEKEFINGIMELIIKASFIMAIDMAKAYFKH